MITEQLLRIVSNRVTVTTAQTLQCTQALKPTNVMGVLMKAPIKRHFSRAIDSHPALLPRTQQVSTPPPPAPPPPFTSCIHNEDSVAKTTTAGGGLCVHPRRGPDSPSSSSSSSFFTSFAVTSSRAGASKV